MNNKKNIENQLVNSGLFTHSALSRHSERINRIEAFLYGLADTLLDSGHISEEHLRDRIAHVAEELRQKGETLSGGVVLRVDADPPPVDTKVDCAERIHICGAVCCRLCFPLSAPEIEDGKIRWELGKPYFARKDGDGRCVHLGKNSACGVYSNRPRICRSYSCEKDERIWKDFEKMTLNQEWIDQNLQPERPRLIAIRMDRIEA